MVKSGWNARKMTSRVMKRSQEDIPVAGRSAEPRSGREGKPAACLGCCGSLHAWARHLRLDHAWREERKEQRTWLWASGQGKEEEVALQDQDRLARTCKLSDAPRVDIALPP